MSEVANIPHNYEHLFVNGTEPRLLGTGHPEMLHISAARADIETITHGIATGELPMVDTESMMMNLALLLNA